MHSRFVSSRPVPHNIHRWLCGRHGASPRLQVQRHRCEDFGKESGLVVNLAKSVIIPLGRQPEPYDDLQLKVLGHTEHTRYLGIQVGTAVSVDHVWQVTIRQIQARLVLAQCTTNNAFQRAQMACAIIIPNFLFVARHHWSSRSIRQQLRRLLRSFVWRHTASPTARSRGWLEDATASLPPTRGGIGLPALDAHLQAMAATQVTRISNQHTIVARKDTPPCQPRRTAAHQPNLRTMTKAGRAVLESVNAIPRVDNEVERIGQAHTLLGQLPRARHGWCNGALHVDISTMLADWKQLAHADHVEHGRLVGPSFEALDINQAGTAIGPNSAHLAASDFKEITAGGVRLQHLLEITWIAPGHIACRPLQHNYPFADNVLAAQFHLLVDSLCATYPQILTMPLLPKQLLAQPDGENFVELVREDGCFYIERINLSTGDCERQPVDHAQQLDRISVQWFGKPKLICTPPALAATLQVYSDLVPVHVTFKKASAHCLVEPQAPPVPHDTASPSVDSALTTLSWERLHGLPDMTASERQTWYRLKAKQWPLPRHHLVYRLV